MDRYRVSENTQVHHAGVTYEGGETLDVDEKGLEPLEVDALRRTVKGWLDSGWVEPVKPKTARKAAK